MTKIMDLNDFNNKIIGAKEIVVVIFRAEWCPDCLFIDSFINEISQSFNSVSVTYIIDIDENPEIKNKYKVDGIPSFIAFKNGIEINRFVNKKRKTKFEISNFYEECTKNK